MTAPEFLDLLRNRVRAPVERNAAAIVRALGDDRSAIEAFQLARVHLDALIDRLEGAQLQDLDRRLAELSGPLADGTRRLKESLGRLEDFAQGADLLATLVGLAARTVALA